MSVLVFHPSVAPFVQQAARALHEAGQLDRFVTSVHDNPASQPQRLVCALGKLAGRDLAAQFRRRAVTNIPAEKVRSHAAGELLRLAVGSIDRDGRATDLVWEKTELAFDRRVSRSLGSALNGVYGFEHSSLATFRRARELGLRTAYDVPAPDSVFVHTLISREAQRFPELHTPYRRHTERREARRLARRRDEWSAANVIIAASAFTKQSYADAGLDTAKVRVVPYGAPPTVTRDEALWTNRASRPITLLWAGTFSVRKGAHCVIHAWRAGALGRLARLRVFGAVDLPERVMQPLPNGIELRGSIARDELMHEYQQADALLFPTLCDGFGMVATEAWSRGLPVITTSCAGVADLVKPQENGLLIRAGDSGAIEAAVHWCSDHRRQLAAMRESALATAAAWQWSDYRQALVRTLDETGFFPRAA